MKIRANKAISVILSIVMVLTIVMGTIWALSGLFKVGMSIQVKYDPLVNAKVYLSTDSTGAGNLMQPNSTQGNVVTVNNFKKANSALILNTYDTDNNGGKVKSTFEALGKDSSGLICDADGEMQFYVYVENFSSENSVYYIANISFGDGSGTTPEATPFNVVENPDYAVSSAVSGSTGGGVTSSLLTFKIALNDEYTGDSGTIRADKIKIEIELANSYLELNGVIFGKYTSGTFAEEGMYYLEMGKAPQSYVGTDANISASKITPDKTWVDGNNYYKDNNNPSIEYVKKGDNYYLVEPVRWIILADERYTGTGILGVNYLSDKTLTDLDKTALGKNTNQLIVLSEKLLMKGDYAAELQPSYFPTFLTSVQPSIFTEIELGFIDLINVTSRNGQYYKTLGLQMFQLATVVSESEQFFYNSYLKTNQSRVACYTAYANGSTTSPTTGSKYWGRSTKTGTPGLRSIDSSGDIKGEYGTSVQGVRLGFVISFI